MYLADTVAAIATPLGSGGIGIIRVSGPDAERIGSLIFTGVKGGGFESHRLYYGRFVDPVDGSLIDEGMAVLMRAPRSYTREDVLELHCHGGYLVVYKLLQAAVSSGARPAEPGEFTRRAFLNGRIDLCQAESVLDVINSRTGASLALANRQREGMLGRQLADIRMQLIGVLALIEAHIDFPEEDIELASLAVVTEQVESVRALITRLLASFNYGKVMREGVSLLLAGKPNTGKSSLLNALLCEERAIVSSIPGTTRDLIEETVSIKGLPVRIIDAAGIRHDHHDEVEKEGIRRTLERLSEADMTLFLVDGTCPLDRDDQAIMSAISGRISLTVITKHDIASSGEMVCAEGCIGQVHISSKTGYNLDRLRDLIFDYFTSAVGRDSDDLAVLSTVRHNEALCKALAAINIFSDHAASSFPPELLAADLRDALSAIGEITGETTPDAVLDVIFSSFCIGK